MENDLDTTFLFGDFELSAANRRLLKHGETVSLNSKTFDLLLFLVENHGRVVTKDELLGMVWEGQFVEENNLTVQIAALRKIFGDKKDDYQFIATVHRKGYKFVADVQPVAIEKNLANYFALASLEQTKQSHESSKKILGRAQEISAVCSMLRDAECRLITLSGAGGSGKTLLSRAISEQITKDFPDGVFFVELSSINEPDFLITAIANALDLKETGEKSLMEVLSEYLKDKKTLLILDNFEQIISAAPIIENLISESDLLKILITSRSSLNLNIEREFAVLPLSFPPADASVSINELEKYPAIELFARKAHSVRESFLVDEENFDVVSSICRRLDGLPLAIELAAARVRLLSPQAIFSRLSDSLSLLSGGAKNLPERQQTMRGAIQWSYDLLDENEQILFRQLSVFAGGFSIEAAETVAGKKSSTQNGKLLTDSNDESTFENSKNTIAAVDKSFNILDLLTSLIENNLLFVKELQDGEVRLQMLEVVREFACECLESLGETDTLRRSHAAYFSKLAEEAEPHLFGEKSVEWLKILETENANLRAALNYLFENDSEPAVRMAAAIRYFWIHRSYLSEGREFLSRALEKSGGKSTETRFKILYSLAMIARVSGDYPSAEKLYRTALDEGQKAADKKQIALSCNGLGAILQIQGDADSSKKFFQKGLKYSRETNDEQMIAHSLLCLGIALGIEGKSSEARKLLEESLAMVRRFESLEAISNNLNNIAAVAFDEGDFPAAREYFLEGLRLSYQVGNKVNIIDALNGFAALAAEEQKFEDAAKLAGAAEKIKVEINFHQEPAEKKFCEEYIAKIRSALDTKVFETAFKSGAFLTLNEAVEFAVSSAGILDEQATEIIFETRKYKRIIIEEEIELDDGIELENDISALSDQDQHNKV